jgi:hypothetical protein
MNKYMIDWSNKNDLQHDFAVTLDDSINIIVAAYTYQDYSGSAFVAYEQGGVVYEVNGSHCSCYGLEGQWEPEPVVWKELLARKHYVGYGLNIDGDIRAALVDYYIESAGV